MSGFSLPSEEALKAGGGGDFKLLPEDEYIAQIESIEVLPNQVSQYHVEPHDEWKVRFELISFSNQDPLYYEDSSEPDPSKPVRLSAYIDPARVGMVPQPARARKFITAALGIAVADGIELDSIQSLVGKRVILRTIHKADREGKARDRISDYRVLRQRGAPAARQPAPAPVKPTDAQVEEAAESLLAAAKEVFAADTKPQAEPAGVFEDDLKF